MSSANHLFDSCVMTELTAITRFWLGLLCELGLGLIYELLFPLVLGLELGGSVS